MEQNSNLYFLEPPQRYAILVSGKEDYEKSGVAKIINALSKEFERRGFTCVSMKEFVFRERLEGLLELAQKRCKNTQRNPTIVFYYIGNYDPKEGFVLDDGNYSTEDLMERLREIRGEKLGIFDCCLAGNLMDYSEEDLTILAATARDRYAYAISHPGESLRGPIFGRALLRVFERIHGNIALVDMFCETGRQFVIKPQQPQISYPRRFTIPEKC